MTVKIEEFNNIITIKRENGNDTIIKIIQLPAMSAWELQAEYTDFKQTKDKKYREDFTVKLLSNASVVLDNAEIQLNTKALINNHLRSWVEIKTVFEAILNCHQIDPQNHSENPNYWTKAGKELATSFTASVVELITPFLTNDEK